MLLALGALLAGPAAHLAAPDELDHHLGHGASQLAAQVVLGAHHEHDGPHAEAELAAVDPHRHDPCGSCLRSLREVGSTVAGSPLAQGVDAGAVAGAAGDAFTAGVPTAAPRPRGPPALV
jgi:hypothetical protein